MIKTIPTEYNGTEYRSRTEARWAVFMSAIRCRFLYEPEGFDLGKDGWYIPDFYLPDCEKFVEIKPSVPVAGRESPTKALAVASGISVITFCGPPSPPDEDYDDLREDGFLNTPEGGWDSYYWFCMCPKCGRAGIEFNGRADRIKCNCEKSPHGDKGYNTDCQALSNAYRAAAKAFRYNPRKRK